MPAARTSKSPPRVELRFSGSGGQGILLAATLLAEAATDAGREVVMTQSYGPEARGGASKAEVIIADEAIDYPEVVDPDLTLCLSQEAYDAYAALTRPGGIVVTDDRLVEARPVDGVRLLPAALTQTAVEAVGAVVAANVVALGLIQKVTGVVTRAALEAALRRRLPPRLVAANLRALKLGVALAPGAAEAPAKASGKLPGGSTGKARGPGRRT